MRLLLSLSLVLLLSASLSQGCWCNDDRDCQQFRMRGKPWCYVEHHSPCYDARPARIRPEYSWSHEACRRGGGPDILAAVVNRK